MTILIFVGFLIVIILAHELGHFVTAKLTGVTVEEFGLFYPPRLFSIKRGGTIYSINALPLGGFVKMAGEEDPDAPGSLASKSIPKRLLVLGSGSLMNLLLPLLLLWIAFMIPHGELTGEVQVVGVSPGSPAEAAGIEPEDVFISINNEPISSIDDIERVLTANLEVPVSFIMQRGSDTVETMLVPRSSPPEGEGASGVSVRSLAVNRSYTFWEAIPRAADRYGEILTLFRDGIVGMVRGVLPVDIRGPVGIAQMTEEAARYGTSALLEFAALISLNLGIINLFPIPALDGGRLVFVLIEFVRRGKRVAPKTERLVHAIGFILLLAAMVVVTSKDIARIISGGDVLP